MAEDKKSFILYSDLIHTIKLLSKEDAGELFLHILKYVNDENPVADNKIIDIVFTPIKIQLKRDLEKWSEKKGSFSDAGKESAKARRLSKPQLYVLKFFNNDEAFIKVGITDYSIGRRYSSSGEGGGKVGYKFEIIHQYFEGDGSIGILELEQKVSAKFSQYKYAPEHKFGGHMECYCENKCNEIIQYITSFNIVEQTSTKSTVSVNDNVNVTVNVNDNNRNTLSHEKVVSETVDNEIFCEQSAMTLKADYNVFVAFISERLDEMKITGHSSKYPLGTIKNILIQDFKLNREKEKRSAKKENYGKSTSPTIGRTNEDAIKKFIADNRI